MLSYVLPTRNRPDRLARTLDAIGELSAGAHDSCGGAEVIIIDNASSPPAAAPLELANGFPVRVIHLDHNEGAAARNRGVEAAQGEWVVMLDDDSHPLGCGHLDAIADAEDDVAAIGAEILLPGGRRESGGLPEVFVGCGVAIRRDEFLACGGYDPALHYYAEEYDLSARLLLRERRIQHSRRFQVLHEKTDAGRDFNVIVRRLVRNNAWIMRRYAPKVDRRARIRETFVRYGGIALREGAMGGYVLGAGEAIRRLASQPLRTMDRETFDRFTGVAAARETLGESDAIRRSRWVALIDRGKNAWAVAQALEDLGKVIVETIDDPEVLVIGSLSPGPMQDAYERHVALGNPVVAPWRWESPVSVIAAAAGCAAA